MVHGIIITDNAFLESDVGIDKKLAFDYSQVYN